MSALGIKYEAEEVIDVPEPVVVEVELVDFVVVVTDVLAVVVVMAVGIISISTSQLVQPVLESEQ
jgi:hypothetical protein